MPAVRAGQPGPCQKVGLGVARQEGRGRSSQALALGDSGSNCCDSAVSAHNVCRLLMRLCRCSWHLGWLVLGDLVPHLAQHAPDFSQQSGQSGTKGGPWSLCRPYGAVKPKAAVHTCDCCYCSRVSGSLSACQGPSLLLCNGVLAPFEMREPGERSQALCSVLSFS